MQTILVTGGAGFIGAHLGAELVRAGYQVRALDALVAHVHGPGIRRPAHLDARIDLVIGDVRDRQTVARALEGVEAVVHLAALAGVGRSVDQLADYTSVAATGTAVLLEALRHHPVARLVVGSSMSVYGEGLYRDERGDTVSVPPRSAGQLRAGMWEVRGGVGSQLVPIPTPESAPPTLPSIYALTRFEQERLCMLFGKAHDVPTVALRFFNVYGPHQARGAALTEITTRLLYGRPPILFEDGLQRRDFVHVSDVARACRLAIETEVADGRVFNVGSGSGTTIAEVAGMLAAATGRRGIAPEITGKHRHGDVRHCFADMALARRVLGFEPRMTLERGLVELAAWLATHEAAQMPRGLAL